MFHYLRDPGADGVGVAFTSADLDLSDSAEPAARLAAFGRLSDAVGAAVAVVRQVHGDRVLEVERDGVGLIDMTDQDADALVTTRRGVALAVRVADCVPVLLADATAGLVGAVHAGRAGAANRVVLAAIDAMRGRGASRIEAWIGPHICAECYEVPEAMASDFARSTGVPPSRTRWGTTGLDIGAAITDQLHTAGVSWSSHEACTMHGTGLHSHRRDAARAGRMVGLVWRV